MDEVQWQMEAPDDETLLSGLRAVDHGQERGVASRFAEFGICAKCKNFKARVHQNGGEERVFAYCMEYGADSGRAQLRLDPRTPVVDCTAHWPAGSPSLKEMEGMATLVNQKKVGHYL